MKQNSDESNRRHQAGIDENLRDGSPASPHQAGAVSGSFDDLECWSREEFEAALPLYVGGELDATESARVDAWLVAHPEDQVALAASKQASGVLARYAEFTRERATPDLWAGIRSGLVANQLLEADSIDPRPATGEMAPILGGPRWFQRKSVAAAAALLLTGSVGLFLMSRGISAGSSAGPSAGSVAPAGSIGGPEAGIAAAQVAATAESPSEMLVGLAPEKANGVAPLAGNSLLSGEAGTAASPLLSSPVGLTLGHQGRRAPKGQSQRLQPAKQGAERLIDDAPKALLWQSDPWAVIRQVRPNRNGAPQLTGGR